MNRPDVTDIKAHEHAAVAAAKQADLKHQRATDDVLVVMRTPQGRRFVYMLLQRTGLDESSFTGNSTTFFKEGKRAFGLELQDFLRTNAKQEYLTMIQEGLNNG